MGDDDRFYVSESREPRRASLTQLFAEPAGVPIPADAGMVTPAASRLHPCCQEGEALGLRLGLRLGLGLGLGSRLGLGLGLACLVSSPYDPCVGQVFPTTCTWLSARRRLLRGARRRASAHTS